MIFYVELIRLNRMSRQKKKEFLLSQPSGLGEEQILSLNFDVELIRLNRMSREAYGPHKIWD
jgi:hypothetical protein